MPHSVTNYIEIVETNGQCLLPKFGQTKNQYFIKISDVVWTELQVISLKKVFDQNIPKWPGKA